MELLLAPIQGVTIAEYRNTYNDLFGGIDAFYAPFISLTNKQEMHTKYFEDIEPSTNSDKLKLVPQLLGNNADYFIEYVKKIQSMGYDEINWNIGCSFSKVAKKRKGSGILSHPTDVKDFLDKVYNTIDCKLSVKMRLGYKDTDEGIRITEIMNDYPLDKIIIHARTGLQQYTGNVDLNAFDKLYSVSKHRVCYNGDIFTYDDYLNIQNKFPKLESIMLGRGGLQDPFLASKIKSLNISDNKTDLIKKLHQQMFNYYEKNTKITHHFLNRMKEFWSYSHVYLDLNNEMIKKIRLSQSIKEYLEAVDLILNNTWYE